MYSSNGVQAYREANITSMTREKMIVLLYEKIVSDLGEARSAIEADDRVRMTQRVNHSQRIVSELRNALDHNIGGEISRNLEALYDFLFHQHLDLLLDRDPRHIDHCLRVLNPLLEAWRSVPVGTGEQAARDQARGLLKSRSGPNHASEQSSGAVPRTDSAVQQAAANERAGTPRATDKAELVSVSA